MKKFLVVAKFFFFFFAILIIVSGLTFKFFSRPLNDNQESIEFIVEDGCNLECIGEKLYQEKIIRNQTTYKIYLKILGIKNIKPSTYYLMSSLDTKEIIEILAK